MSANSISHQPVFSRRLPASQILPDLAGSGESKGAVGSVEFDLSQPPSPDVDALSWVKTCTDAVLQLYSGEIGDNLTYKKLFETITQTTPDADPTPIDPTPLGPTPIDPTSLDPAPIDPTSLDPAPIDPTSLDPAPIDPTSLDPAPIDPTPLEAALTLHLASGNGDSDVKTIRLRLDYDPSRYSEALVRRLGRRLINASETMRNDPDKLISETTWLSPTEMDELINGFCKAFAKSPDAMHTIDQLFETQAEKTPDLIAVACEDQAISYGSLDILSTRLALRLQAQGVEKGSVVALYLPRCVEMIISILAVCKCGAIYLPLSRQVPAARLDTMLQDSGARHMLIKEQNPPVTGQLTIDVETEIGAIVSGLNSGLLPDPALSHHPLSRHHCSADLIYLIYTSGSTGLPKGVAVEHRQVINLVQGLGERIYFGHPGTLRVAMLAPYEFDASVQQIFGALLQGHGLYIVDEQTRLNGQALASWFQTHRIQLSDGTPSHLRLLLDSFPDDDLPPVVQHFIIAGEILPKDVVLDLLHRLKPHPPRITNLYGPTETCVDSTSYDISMAVIRNLPSIPIGNPLPGQFIYIMDRKMRLQPVGVPGEIYIGGNGLARGYWRNDALTQERFIVSAAGERLYKTGDLGRWREDGTIEFMGRNDEQVKIRGYRIEPGEIGQVLARHKFVAWQTVIAIASESGSKHLAAYLVPHASHAPLIWDTPEKAEKEIRDFLAEQLPAYMIPAAIYWIKTIPLNNNGKLDRAQLLATPPALPGKKIAPPIGDEVTLRLMEVWTKVLNKPSIAITDNFFNIGGDSIKAIQIAARMGKMGYKMQLKDIFDHPTIAGLTPFISSGHNGISEEAVIKGQLPLTPIQLDFFAAHPTDAHHYNQTLLLEADRPLDAGMLNAIFQQVVNHHDALRMQYFQQGNGRWQQYNRDGRDKFSIQTLDLPDTTPGDTAWIRTTNDLQKSLDITADWLIKVVLIATAKGQRLLIIIHHLVIDGVSWRILLEDLDTLYRQHINSQRLDLPAKTNSFRAWALALPPYAASPAIQQESSWWEQIGSPASPAIKPEFDSPTNLIGDSAFYTIRLEKERTALLFNDAQAPFSTQINDLLLAALGAGFSRTFGVDRLLIALEGHGREKIEPPLDVSRTIGWFTTTYPVMLELQHAAEWRDFIPECKETLRKTPNKGIGYGLLRHFSSGDRLPSIKPQVLFNYLGQFDDPSPEGSWKISADHPGETRSPLHHRTHDFDFAALVTEGRLSITVSCNKYHFSENTMRQLMAAIEDSLIQIVDYCCSLQDRHLTPSDLTMKNLSLEEFDNIFS